MQNQYYHVAPRYTAGSPAAVTPRIAADIAKTEVAFYSHVLEGMWGAEWQARAKKEGLDGIVESHLVYANHTLCCDIITLRRSKIVAGKRTIIQEGRSSTSVLNEFLRREEQRT